MSQLSNTIFYRARHRRGIDWTALHELSVRPLTWWQSLLVGSATGLMMGLVIVACFILG
ncbi:MAG: hypothetical protein IJ523_10710 [Succinivibrionaceae bacterium]|nr:hypothetical protein [Succinivibrionaceae bacterium]